MPPIELFRHSRFGCEQRSPAGKFVFKGTSTIVFKDTSTSGGSPPDQADWVLSALVQLFSKVPTRPGKPFAPRNLADLRLPALVVIASPGRRAVDLPITTVTISSSINSKSS